MWKLFLDVADGTFRLNGGKGTPHTHCTSDFTSPPPHIKQHKSGNQHFLMGNCIAPFSELAYWGARCSRHAEYFWWSQVVPNLLVETPRQVSRYVWRVTSWWATGEKKENSLILRHKITQNYIPSAPKRVQLTVAALVSPSLCRVTRAEFDVKAVFTLVWWRYNNSLLSNTNECYLVTSQLVQASRATVHWLYSEDRDVLCVLTMIRCVLFVIF